MGDKKRCFRRAICCTPRCFFNQARHAFFLHVCSVLGTSETCAYDRTPHMPKPADCVKTVHGGGKKQSEENKLKVRNFKLKKENETKIE